MDQGPKGRTETGTIYERRKHIQHGKLAETVEPNEKMRKMRKKPCEGERRKGNQVLKKNLQEFTWKKEGGSKERIVNLMLKTAKHIYVLMVL